MPHRPVNVEEWRSLRALVDAYVPRVQAGNSVALGVKSHVLFAEYINSIHDRLHPVFEEDLQAAREACPELRTTVDRVARIEAVVDHDNGSRVTTTSSPLSRTGALKAQPSRRLADPHRPRPG
jgi:hypothetical protein